MIVMTSWDDGHPCDERVAALLGKYGIPGTFFVPIRNSEGRPVLSPASLQTMNAGGSEIAAHTLDHIYLPALSDRDIWRQVAEGKDRLEQMIGQRVSGFCYPGGMFNARVVAAVRACRFEYARTTENLRLDVGCDPLRVPTTLQFFPHTLVTLVANLVRHRDFRRRAPVLARVLTARHWTDRVGALIDAYGDTDAVLHLWGHSWEVAQHGLWTVLDNTLSRLSREARCVSLAELVQRQTER